MLTMQFLQFYGQFCSQIVVAAIGLLTAAANNVVYAKISSTDTSCTSPAGNQPGGQQPSCSGGGLTQQSENQNPSGNAPPGQN